jgi:hypothetical protein
MAPKNPSASSFAIAYFISVWGAVCTFIPVQIKTKNQKSKPESKNQKPKPENQKPNNKKSRQSHIVCSDNEDMKLD